MILFDDWYADNLYRGVLAEPDNDLQRLVLADRLDEIGQAERAEFIRLGCELARIEEFVLCSRTGAEMGDRCNNSDCPRCGIYQVAFFRSLALLQQNWKSWYPDAVATDFMRLGYGMDAQEPEEGIRIHRGFPAEVRAPLDWLRGGGCGHEQGTEMVRSIFSPMVWVCPTCHGTGRTPGHLRELVKKWPIQRVVVTDREPDEEPQGDGTSRWMWWREVPHNPLPIRRGELPVALYDRVAKPLSGILHPYTVFATRESAVTALSDALLQEAREESP